MNASLRFGGYDPVTDYLILFDFQDFKQTLLLLFAATPFRVNFFNTFPD